MDLDINGQLPQMGPGPVADAGADLRPDAATKDSGVDLVVAPADADAKDGGADASGPRPDVSADIAADTLLSTGPDVNASTPDAVSPPESGGAAPVSTGCGVVTTTRYFCDDFESGLSNWTVSGQDWNLTTTTWRSPAHCATDSPNGNYAKDANVAMTMTSSVDLTTATSPVLSFWHKLYMANITYEGVRVNVSTNAGIYWTGILPANQFGDATWWYPNNTSTWSNVLLDLKPYKGTHLKVQFLLFSNPNSPTADGWYIDDVEIREAD
jgi:hypothetical protein